MKKQLEYLKRKWKRRPKKFLLLSRNSKNADWLRLRNDFVTLTMRPVYGVGERHYSSVANENESEISIVVQGPIMHDFDFTWYSIRQYRRMFPSASIILSTWANETSLGRFDALCDVVVSDPSAVPSSRYHANHQMHSSHVGILEAERAGSKYVLKTRSDQRFSNNFLLQSLLNFHTYFPVDAHINQSGRLVTMSLDTFLYRPYGVSDMMTFGRLEDVKKFWSGEFLEPNLPENGHKAMSTFPEVQFCVNFLNRVGETPEWTLQHFLQVLKDRFLILDASPLEISWPKYQSLENRWSGHRGLAHLEEVSFDKWLAIMSGKLQLDPRISLAKPGQG